MAEFHSNSYSLEETQLDEDEEEMDEHEEGEEGSELPSDEVSLSFSDASVGKKDI